MNRKGIFIGLAAALCFITVTITSVNTANYDDICGTCGKAVTWGLTEDGILNIGGWGTMTNYTEDSPAPWSEYAEDITAININEGVTGIGDYSFKGVTQITSVTVPASVLYIGIHAFEDCGALDTVALPSSLQSIWDYAFEGCKDISTVYYSGSSDQWKNIRIKQGNHYLNFAKVLTDSPMVYGVNFKDLSSHWAKSNINTVAAKGIVSGYGDNTFRPDNTISRAEFSKMLITAMFDETFEQAEPWYKPYMEYIYEKGIASREEVCSDFESPITRDEMALMVSRALYLKGEPFETEFNKADSLVDGKTKSVEVKSAIQKGIINGYEDGTFRGGSSLTRAEAVSGILRAVDRTYRTSNVVNKPSLVLMYHSVNPDKIEGDANLAVTPEAFEWQLKYYKEHGFETVFASEASATTTKREIVITFDDGYEDNYIYAYPLLKKYNMKATIFMVAGDIGKENRLSAGQLKEMSDSGLVEIGSHTVKHQNLNECSLEELDNEFANSQGILENIVGKPVRAVAYPGGYSDEIVEKYASEHYSRGFIARPNYNLSTLNDMTISRYGVYRNTDKFEIELMCKRFGY